MFNPFNDTRSFDVVTIDEETPVVSSLLTGLIGETLFGEDLPGITRLGLDVDNATFQVSVLGRPADTLSLDGAEIASILEGLESDSVDIGNDEREFGIVDLDGDPDVEGDGETLDIGNGITLDSDSLEFFLEREVEDDLPAVEIEGIDQDNVTFSVNGDTIIADGASDAIDAVAETSLNVSDDEGEVGVFDVDDTSFFVIGDAEGVSTEFADLVGGASAMDNAVVTLGEAASLVEEVVLGDGVDGVSLLNIDDDTATMTIDNGMAVDYLIIDNADLSFLG